MWHVEVPRLEVKLELELTAYATATARKDLSWVWTYIPFMATLDP